MKKWIALLLAVCMALGLCACAGNTEERYPEIADLLDRGKYDRAIEKIMDMAEEAQGEDRRDDEDEDREDSDYTEEEPAPAAEPASDEDWNLVYQYEDVWNALSYFEPDESFGVYNYTDSSSLYGQEAMAFCYDFLKNAQRLDSWKTYLSESWNSSIDWDREGLLSRFYFHEDVRLSRNVWYEDALGNINQQYDYEYGYTADGTRVNNYYDKYYAYSGGVQYSYAEGEKECTYDDAGRLSQVRWLAYDGSVNSVIDYTYNADGTLASEHYLDRNSKEYTITYTYTDGRLTRAEGMPCIFWFDDIVNVDYSYDSNGNLVRECHVSPGRDSSNWTYRGIVDYTYNAAGQLESVTKYVEEYRRLKLECYEYVYHYTYSYDEAGHLIRSTCAGMGYFDAEGNRTSTGDYDTYISDYTYGDYIGYSPAES